MRKIVIFVFRGAIRFCARYILNADIPIATQRQRLEWLGRCLRPALGTRSGKVMLGKVAALAITGSWEIPEGAVILYFHGGAFIVGSPATHLGMTSLLGRAAGARVYSVDYRLAPEHPAPAALEDCIAAYEDLLAQGEAAHRIIVGGDSAGGGLALSCCQQIRDRGLPRPAGLLLLSPFADMTLSGSSMGINEPLLTLPWMVQGGDAYRGNLEKTDPRISPLFADMQGLPPALIRVGTDEKLLEDSRRIHSKLREAGVDCDYAEGDGLWHVWQYFASTGFGPSRQDIRAIGAWCQRQVLPH